MGPLKTLEKHLTNINLFRAYTPKQLLSELVRFPYDYYFRDGKSSFPLNISLLLTLRCNARCRMCNFADMLNKGKVDDPSLEVIEDFIRKIAPKKPSLVLIGGEPFLRKDFLDILRIIKRHKLSCGVFTNGLLLNEDIIKELVDLKLDYIAFSLQGPEAIHDKITKIPGAYRKLVGNLETFCKLKRKTRVVIHTTISESNIEHLGHIVELGNKFNVDLVRFGHPIFFTENEVKMINGFCSQHFPNEPIGENIYSYDPREKTDVFVKNLVELKNKYNGQFRFTPDLSTDEIKVHYSSDYKTLRKCLFVWRATFVYPNGMLHPCESINYEIGNVFEDDFEGVWNGDKFVDFRRKLKRGLFPVCARCCKL